ncbi:E3 ubiquitin-protein ligase RNF180-like [Panonychus citri]|uniref:E3 ubiquitin-protein ligase RNF180-like n=1 Tax=Panonychus citri TaxID=50023 RepID=UPI002307A7DD|nr:E3 ubiquitin-protein ligase RNF180-like [Panonychus citri]
MFKCKKCRKDLIKLEDVVNSHGESADDDSVSCSPENWYLNEESINSITWIKDQIDCSLWTKGKLSCPHKCGARLGSFNFIEGLRCNCSKSIVPSAHIIKKRVDCPSQLIVEILK